VADQESSFIGVERKLDARFYDTAGNWLGTYPIVGIRFQLNGPATPMVMTEKGHILPILSAFRGRADYDKTRIVDINVFDGSKSE